MRTIEVPKKKKVVDGVNLIYPMNRYYDSQSPTPIFVPTSEVLFKMMKACVDIKKEEELWIKLGE